MSDALKTLLVVVGLFLAVWAALDGATRCRAAKARQPDCCQCEAVCECKTCRCCEGCK